MAAAGRNDRLWPDAADNRTPAERDRDRVLYTSALQRLAEVTQVLAPDEGHVFHNRLTHSLKVAQVGRSIAGELLRRDARRADLAGGLDASVVEAAALGHDLGHPPFGHIAEDELRTLLEQRGVSEGFDGNAQSFRIVTKLALRCDRYSGLNLTRATLNAVLKYPWLRGSHGKRERKWGAYSTELTELKWARELMPPDGEHKSAEAELMDWADDVTYAVHDLADFYKAGLIPLDRLAAKNPREREAFYRDVFSRESLDPYTPDEIQATFERLAYMMPFDHPYQGTNSDRADLRQYTAGLIGTYVRYGIELGEDATKRRVIVNPETEKELFMLKQLTWHYVIGNPALATQQHGQRRVISTLFEVFADAAAHPEKWRLFPFAFRELLEADHTADPALRIRIVCDYIAGMTERQALELYRKLAGVSPGSALH